MRTLIALLFSVSMLVGNASAESHADARDVAFREQVTRVFATVKS